MMQTTQTVCPKLFSICCEAKRLHVTLNFSIKIAILVASWSQNNSYFHDVSSDCSETNHLAALVVPLQKTILPRSWHIIFRIFCSTQIIVRKQGNCGPYIRVFFKLFNYSFPLFCLLAKNNYTDTLRFNKACNGLFQLTIMTVNNEHLAVYWQVF